MQELNGILGMIVPFLFSGFIVFLVFYFRHARRREAEQTIRAAIEKGIALEPEVVAKLLETPRRHGPSRLRIGGVIVMFVGIGLAAMHAVMAEGGGNDDVGLLGAGVLVGIIGAGILLASFLAKPNETPTLPPQV